MTLLRTEEHARLTQLQSVGQGMPQSYRDLPDAPVGPLGRFLNHVEGQRQQLLDELAATQRSRGDIPPAVDR